MKPKPMSESEIVKYLADAGCIGTVKMTFDSGPYEITRTSINADRFARAIIAARDAQWSAIAHENERLRECLEWLQERHQGGLMRAKIDEALGADKARGEPT